MANKNLAEDHRRELQIADDVSELFNIIKEKYLGPDHINTFLFYYRNKRDWLIQNNHPPLPNVKELLQTKSTNPPLVVAAYLKRYDLFNILAQNGANPNQVALESEAGWSGMSTFDALTQHNDMPTDALDTLLIAVGNNDIVLTRENHDAIWQKLNHRQNNIRHTLRRLASSNFSLHLNS